MSTSVNPESQQSQSPEGTPVTTEPTNTPAAPAPDNSNLLTFYAEQARIAREDSSRMAQELAEARARESSRTNAPAPVDYTNYNTALSEGRGAEAIAEIVRNEVARTIKPIADNISEFRARETAQSDYTRLKNTYRNLPYFASIESDVDSVMQNAPVNAQAMDAAIRMVIGNAALMGKTIVGINGTSNTNAAPINNTVPAQLSPSNPAAPARIVNGQAVVTEKEKDMAAKQNMTVDEYVFWRDVSPQDVVKFKWDKTTNVAVRV